MSMFKRLFATAVGNDPNAVDVTEIKTQQERITFINNVQSALGNDKFVLPRKTENKLYLDCNNVDDVTAGLNAIAKFSPARQFTFYVTDGKSTSKYTYSVHLSTSIIVHVSKKQFSKTFTIDDRESVTQISLSEPCENVAIESLISDNNRLFVYTAHFNRLHRKNMYEFKSLESFRWCKEVDVDELDFNQMFLDIFKQNDNNIITVCDYALINPINMAAFISRGSVTLPDCVTEEFLFVRAIFIREFIKHYKVSGKYTKFSELGKFYNRECGTVTTGFYAVNQHDESKLLEILHNN